MENIFKPGLKNEIWDVWKSMSKTKMTFSHIKFSKITNYLFYSPNVETKYFEIYDGALTFFSSCVLKEITLEYFILLYIFK